jgi:preprotein translocase subunit SecG
MYILMWIVHVIVCLFLIIVVLLQSGKAADLAGAFGGMGSQTAFGPRGSATLLSKATTISAILFMVTSLSLSILATRNAGLGTTVLESAPAKSGAPAPAKSAPAPVQIPASPATPAPQGQGQQAPIINVTPPGQAAPQQSTPAQPAPAKKK